MRVNIFCTLMGLSYTLMGQSKAAYESGVMSAEKKMNVLFIMSDQHNANALGCYGHKLVKTPNIDKIASEGVLFNNAFCQTGQSVPSRYSIFTGRYARTTGTYSNGNGQDAAENTVADLFSAEGYVCATIGKHHMIMNSENNNHGFSVVEIPVGGHRTNKPLPKDEVYPGRSLVGPSVAPNDKHTCGLTAQQTINFIRDNKDNPFVVWCSFVGPHTPIMPSSPWAEMYDYNAVELPPNFDQIDNNMPDGKKLALKSGKFSTPDYHKKTTAYYWGLISQIDYNIGLVLDELKRLNLDKNTIIVYTADHGEMMAEHGAWTKGITCYDATIRVPYIISYPSLKERGQKRDELVCSIDLLPTLLDLAGVTIPSNIQGKSLVPLMENEAGEWRDCIYSEIYTVSTSSVCVRTANSKYVRFMRGNNIVHEQLFDMVNDPWEIKNLINDAGYSAVRNDLKSRLKEWEDKVETKEPIILDKKNKKQKR